MSGFRAERCPDWSGTVSGLERNHVRLPVECCPASTGIRIQTLGLKNIKVLTIAGEVYLTKE
jgi:hypothetical protein